MACAYRTRIRALVRLVQDDPALRLYLERLPFLMQIKVVDTTLKINPPLDNIDSAHGRPQTRLNRCLQTLYPMHGGQTALLISLAGNLVLTPNSKDSTLRQVLLVGRRVTSAGHQTLDWTDFDLVLAVSSSLQTPVCITVILS